MIVAYAHGIGHVGMFLVMQGMPTEAVYWFKEAAKQRYPEALHQLGRCYITGTGIEANEALGIG